KNLWARAPGHDAVGRRRVGRSTGDDVGRVCLRHAAIDIAPAAGRAQRNRAALIAGRETLDRHDGHAVGRTDVEDRGMEFGAGRGLALSQSLAGAAGDADMKCNGHRLVLKSAGDEAYEALNAGFAPRRGTPRPPVRFEALAGLPACGAGFPLRSPPSR